MCIFASRDRVNELGEKGERPAENQERETFFHSPAAAVLRSCRIIKFLNSGESEVFMYAVAAVAAGLMRV